MAKNLFSIIIIVVITVYSGISLLHSGLPPTHDGEYHVVRFYEFDKSLKDGNLYPRWAPDLDFGFGVPLFNYVYPLPNYLASVIHFLGFSFIDSFKLSLFFASVIGSLFIYFWSKSFWGNFGGFVSAVIYIFSPYKFVDIFIRGSVGEIWALSLFPALLFFSTKALKEKNDKLGVLSGVIFALTILSHNILALMFSIFYFAYLVFLYFEIKDRKKIILYIFNISLIGLGLSSIFWLPAILEKKFVTGLQIYNIEDNFPEIYELIFPSWGSGFSQQNLGTQMSTQIGLANLLIVFMVLVFVFIRKHFDNKKLLIFFLSAFFIIFFLMTRQSLFIWKTIPFMDYFQFSWRFLSLEIIIASFLAGSLVNFIRYKPILILLCVISILLVKDYNKVPYYLERPDSYYLTRSNFIDGTNSPGNYFNTVWSKKRKEREKEKLKILSGDVKILSSKISSNKYDFKIDTKNEAKFLVNVNYFPGWTVYVDNVNINITQEKGQISFIIPKNSKQINIQFLDTPTRKIATYVFFITLVYALYLISYEKIHKKHII